MTNASRVSELAVDGLAARLNALRGTAAYAAYLVEAADINAIAAELADELKALTSGDDVIGLSPASAEQLVNDLSATHEIVIVDAHSYAALEWAQVDRRRSEIEHRGIMVFITTPQSFDALMRSAPNLASWINEVFAHPARSSFAQHSASRLAALRAWADKTDEQVIEAARAGALPRDPEYAEWLVLLGHGDLLDVSAR
jgi:hypothetical protein